MVLITGAAGGIGGASARHLAKKGYQKLALADIKELELEEVAKDCRELGAKDVLVIEYKYKCTVDGPLAITFSLQSIKVDLADPNACRASVGEVITRYGQLDSVFANAGICKYGSFDDFTLEAWDANFSVNMRANFVLTQSCLPFLRKTKGTIVYTASVAGVP